MQCYSYSPLASHAIRLLSLHDRASPTFSGSLQTFNLANAPEYFCLSYTWGSQSEDVEIYIDSQVLHVRPSLVDMLRRLQELAADNTASDLLVKWVWIDRICINQEDLDERSDQVRCMGDIYSQAVRTIIWAGPDLDGCSSAWPLVDQIYNICMRIRPRVRYLADIPLRIYTNQNHADSQLPLLEDQIWEHLRKLFSLPWFTRTWVIQEVALSSKDPIILHGQHRYPWERLGWAASWLRRNGYLRLKDIPDQLQNCDTISNIRRSRHRWQLDALLATTSVKFKSTDQRDKIFGLLGLAAETENTQDLPLALVPDYNSDVWEVYTRVVLHFIKTYRTLPTLAIASGVWDSKARRQHETQFEMLPSWVPNWSDCCVSNSEHTKGFSWLYYSNTGDATTYGFPSSSKASDGLPAEILDSDHDAVLRLTGLIAGTIVSAIPYDETSEATKRESIVGAWEAFVQIAPAINGTDGTKAFINASTAEQHSLSGKSADQIEMDGAAYLFENYTTRAAAGNLNENIMQTLKSMALDGKPESYLSLATNFCHNRSFVVTSDGCIGIGALEAQIGDSVAVIFGGGVPYTIRRDGGSFLFVGECYIHGLMKGEAIQKWRDGRLKKEVLEFH